MRHRILAAILDFVGETKKRKKKNYQTNSPGPVCILQLFGNNPSTGFRKEHKQVAAAAAGGLSKNNKSPPPHSGWRLENITTKWDVFQFEIIIKCLSQLFLIHLNTRFLCYGVYGGYLKPANVANFFQEFILTTAVKASLL